MWEDEILEELHRIHEEHAKSFNYDFKVKKGATTGGLPLQVVFVHNS